MLEIARILKPALILSVCLSIVSAAAAQDGGEALKKPRFWLHSTVIAQMDSDEGLERVMLFSRDGGHYPHFDLYVNHYAVVDEATGEVQYTSGELLSTGRDLVVEDRDGDGRKELYLRYISGGEFSVDERGGNFTALWSYDCIEVDSPKKVVLGYVTSWSSSVPDPSLLTHINYAFGHVSDTFDGVRVDNPDRLRRIEALKLENSKLKVMLSIGGWGSGRFSEMAADESLRKSFAADCRRVVDEFRLDGIDIDWEYPTIGVAGISASPDDRANFTLLVRDVREAVGTDKLLTLATLADAGGDVIDFRAIMPHIDFVNMMTYDLNQTGRRHHSGLYRSELSPDKSVHEATESHLAAGVPAHKLVMGVPFYGRAIEAINEYTNYRDLIKLTQYDREWDEKAQAPYLSDPLTGLMVAGYDDARSLKIKTEYIRTRGLRGIMYWDFDGDDAALTLSKTIFYGLYPQER